MDRRQAMASGEDLPDRTTGAAMFADVSGFTPLTDALVKQLGARRAVEELTLQLNLVYDALIAQVHHFSDTCAVVSAAVVDFPIALGIILPYNMHETSRVDDYSGKGRVPICVAEPLRNAIVQRTLQEDITLFA